MVIFHRMDIPNGNRTDTCAEGQQVGGWVIVTKMRSKLKKKT